MGQDFRLITEGEPRGKYQGEPRKDDLYLHPEDQCWKNEDDKRVCGAFRSSADWEFSRCSQPTKQGRCYHHGGHSLKGKDHPDYKNGRYAEALPDGIAGRFQEVMQDESLTNLRKELAAIQTRIEEVMSSLEDPDTGELWSDIQKHLIKLQDARAAGNSDEESKQLHILEDLITSGAEERAKYREISELIERKRRLVDSERRREKALQAYVPLEDFIMSMHTVDDILRRHIDDPTTMQNIARELRSKFDLG